MYIKDGIPFDIFKLNVIGEVQYPAGWFFDEANREAMGIEPLAHSEPPAVTAAQKLALVGYDRNEAGQWVAKWAVEEKTEADVEAERAALAARVKILAAEIDAAAIAVFAKPTTLARVYERREAEAIAYRDAGFTGVAGPYIKNFAEPSGLTDQAAAELVLQQAEMLRGAQDQLEALRMKKNEVARAATLEDAESVAAGVMAGIAAIAAQI